MVNKLIKNHWVPKGLGERIKGRREKWSGAAGKQNNSAWACWSWVRVPCQIASHLAIGTSKRVSKHSWVLNDFCVQGSHLWPFLHYMGDSGNISSRPLAKGAGIIPGLQSNLNITSLKLSSLCVWVNFLSPKALGILDSFFCDSKDPCWPRITLNWLPLSSQNCL